MVLNNNQLVATKFKCWYTRYEQHNKNNNNINKITIKLLSVTSVLKLILILREWQDAAFLLPLNAFPFSMISVKNCFPKKVWALFTILNSGCGLRHEFCECKTFVRLIVSRYLFHSNSSYFVCSTISGEASSLCSIE